MSLTPWAPSTWCLICIPQETELVRNVPKNQKAIHGQLTAHINGFLSNNICFKHRPLRDVFCVVRQTANEGSYWSYSLVCWITTYKDNYFKITFGDKMLIVQDVSIKNEVFLPFSQWDLHLKIWFAEGISIMNCQKNVKSQVLTLWKYGKTPKPVETKSRWKHVTRIFLGEIQNQGIEKLSRSHAVLEKNSDLKSA